MFSKTLRLTWSWLPLLYAHYAAAQACCAGASAVTPARLDVHDEALIGMRIRTADVVGSYSADGDYHRNPAGTGEADFNQDLFGALRLLPRAQVAVLVPFLETYRKTRQLNEWGGGLGDLNFSGRYDWVRARESSVVPGIGLLLGCTIPSGRAPENARKPLATDATGVGALQGNLGVAVEQLWGPWLVSATWLVALRAPHEIHRIRISLAPEYTLLGSLAYATHNGASASLGATYAIEGNGNIAGQVVPDSNRRLLTMTLSGLWSLTEKLRTFASSSLNPPFSSWGANRTVAAGITLGMLGTIQ
jgi:hypothetical protein